jgi:hypothetical protein
MTEATARSNPSVDRKIAGLITALACSYVLWRFRSAWFFGDEWSYIVDRRAAWSNGRYGDALFLPHNEHWTTLPILAYSMLFKVFALKSYLPYMVLLVALHGIAVLALHTMLVRVGVGRVAALGGTLLFALFGAGAENLSWAFQIGFVGSITLGLLHLLTAERATDSRWRSVGGPMLGLLNVMTSGLALPMLATVGIMLGIQRRYRSALINVGPAALAYAMWWISYGNKRVSPPSRPELWVGYVEKGVFTTLEETTHLKWMGAVLTVALLIAASRWWKEREQKSIPLASLIGLVVMFLMLAIGRSSFGVDQAASSRYLYGAGALVIGPLLLMTKTLIADTNVRKWVTSVGLILAITGNASAVHLFAIGRLEAVHQSKRQILDVARRPDLATLTNDIVPDPTFTPWLRASHLADLVRAGLLPIDEQTTP